MARRTWFRETKTTEATRPESANSRFGPSPALRTSLDGSPRRQPVERVVGDVERLDVPGVADLQPLGDPVDDPSRAISSGGRRSTPGNQEDDRRVVALVPRRANDEELRHRRARGEHEEREPAVGLERQAREGHDRAAAASTPIAYRKALARGWSEDGPTPPGPGGRVSPSSSPGTVLMKPVPEDGRRSPTRTRGTAAEPWAERRPEAGARRPPFAGHLNCVKVEPRAGATRGSAPVCQAADSELCELGGLINSPSMPSPSALSAHEAEAQEADAHEAEAQEAFAHEAEAQRRNPRRPRPRRRKPRTPRPKTRRSGRCWPSSPCRTSGRCRRRWARRTGSGPRSG